MKKVWIIIGAVLLVLAVGGGAFWAGMAFGQSRAVQSGGRPGPEGFREWNGQLPEGMATRQVRQRDDTQAGGNVRGTIQSIEGSTLVIDTGDETITVETTDTTLIEKVMSVGVDDLEIDEQVVVSGRQNDDGSITARSIQPLRVQQIGQPQGGQ